MRLTYPSLAACAVLSLGCRSEIPSPATVCWEGMAVGTSNPWGCEPQMCFPEVQRAALPSGSWHLYTSYLETQEPLSTDAMPRNLRYIFSLSDINVRHNVTLHVDNRITLEPTTANFQKYVRKAEGIYETHQGITNFVSEDIEVLRYDNGRLAVRIHTTFDGLTYWTKDLSGHTDVCSYRPGGSGDPDLGELVLDADGSIDVVAL
jgi:hypothetical protein